MTLGAFCNTISFIFDYDFGHIGRSRWRRTRETGRLGPKSQIRGSRLASRAHALTRGHFGDSISHSSRTPTRGGTWHIFVGMTSHSYEIALYGKFQKGDLKPVLNRIALHSESAHQMHSREIVFDPPDAALQREANQEPALLRAKKELLEPDAKW